MGKNWGDTPSATLILIQIIEKTSDSSAFLAITMFNVDVH